jgi:hypothetical protein
VQTRELWCPLCTSPELSRVTLQCTTPVRTRELPCSKQPKTHAKTFSRTTHRCTTLVHIAPFAFKRCFSPVVRLLCKISSACIRCKPEALLYDFFRWRCPFLMEADTFFTHHRYSQVGQPPDMDETMSVDDMVCGTIWTRRHQWMCYMLVLGIRIFCFYIIYVSVPTV